jgi:hypothetical protein
MRFDTGHGNTRRSLSHDLKECLQGALETLALRSKVRVDKADFFSVTQQRCGTSCHLCGCALNTALSLGLPARLFQSIYIRLRVSCSSPPRLIRCDQRRGCLSSGKMRSQSLRPCAGYVFPPQSPPCPAWTVSGLVMPLARTPPRAYRSCFLAYR